MIKILPVPERTQRLITRSIFYLAIFACILVAWRCAHHNDYYMSYWCKYALIDSLQGWFVFSGPLFSISTTITLLYILVTEGTLITVEGAFPTLLFFIGVLVYIAPHYKFLSGIYKWNVALPIANKKRLCRVALLYFLSIIINSIALYAAALDTV